MTRTTIILLLVILFSVPSAEAFDDIRKGFVVGLGLGLAPTVSAEGDSVSYDKLGFGFSHVIGYAWNESDMLVYEGNGAGFLVDTAFYGQGIDALAWYHYWGPTGKSLYTVLGYGFYGYGSSQLWNSGGKEGMLLGVGYEFAKHFQVGFYYSSGKTNLRTVHDHTTFAILINGVLY